jgi:hypothetical protein
MATETLASNRALAENPMKTNWILAGLFTFATSLNLWADETLSLNPHLEPLRPLLGKTWQGSFKGSKPEKPTIDVAKWERALNGQAVRMLHSINQGVYGGETLFVWNEQKQTLSYHYFTTAGFMTSGTMVAKDGKFVTHEEVLGDTSGITEVRATSELMPDGKFHVNAEYLKNGKWTPGHEVTYHEEPHAELVFK